MPLNQAALVSLAVKNLGMTVTEMLEAAERLYCTGKLGFLFIVSRERRTAAFCF